MSEIDSDFAVLQGALKILIVKHSAGNRFGGPAEDLEEFLISGHPGASITVVSHPLTSWSILESTIRMYSQGVLASKKIIPRRIKGSSRYIFDIFFGPKRAEYDYVFGFNGWALCLGLLLCKNQNAQVVAWGVDYVPPDNKDRVGPLSFLLNLLERLLSQRVNVRVENTSVALTERAKRSHLPSSAKSFVVPIGVWGKDFVAVEDLQQKIPSKLVYLGGVNERTGAPLLVAVLDELNQMNIDFTCDVIGDGPLLGWLKDEIEKRGLRNRVFAHGYLPDLPDTRQILAKSSIGLAPFSADPGNFTSFTDPQKIRRYLSSGLVVVSSKVPPIAKELTIEFGLIGLEADESAKSWAKTVADLLGNPGRLRNAQRAALDYSNSFENSKILGRVLQQILRT